MNDMLMHQLVSDRIERALEEAHYHRAARRRRPKVREALAAGLVSAGLRLAPCREALLSRIASSTRTA